MRTLLMVLIAVVSVSCSAANPTAGQPGDNPFYGLPLPDDISVRSVSTIVDHLDGAEYTIGAKVSVNGPDAVYVPTGDGAGEVAYGLYMFSLEGFEQGRFLEQTWADPPPSGSLWLGLGDRTRNRWEWLQPALAEPLLIGDIAPYLNEQDELFIVVVVTESGEFTLASLDITGQPPEVIEVAPLAIAPGEPAVMTANVTGTGVLSYAWDFGGGVSPNTSADGAPAVTALGEGTYSASLQVSNLLGTDRYDFELTVGIVLPDLSEGQLVAIALDQAVTTGEIASILVMCGDIPPAAPFSFMNSVAVTWETGAEYAPHTFNLGALGGAVDDIDGIWAAMDPAPSGFLLPDNNDLVAYPVTDDPGRMYLSFNITPLGGLDVLAGGELFNFGISFTEPGIYNLGFLEFQNVKRTYYSDHIGFEYYWLDTTNDGVPHTISVTEP